MRLKKFKKGEAIFSFASNVLDYILYSRNFLNSEKKERREAQLAKKAETIKAFASEVVLQSPTQMLIDGRPYILEKNYRNGFEVEKLEERFSNILTKYDYIVGDWVMSNCGCGAFMLQVVIKEHQRKVLNVCKIIFTNIVILAVLILSCAI